METALSMGPYSQRNAFKQTVWRTSLLYNGLKRCPELQTWLYSSKQALKKQSCTERFLKQSVSHCLVCASSCHYNSVNVASTLHEIHMALPVLYPPLSLSNHSSHTIKCKTETYKICQTRTFCKQQTHAHCSLDYPDHMWTSAEWLYLTNTCSQDYSYSTAQSSLFPSALAQCGAVPGTGDSSSNQSENCK